jgi:Ca2+-transporting ATPase
MLTEIGRIAGLLKQTPDEATPLQRELDRTGKLLGLVVVIIAVVMSVTIIVVEDVHGASALFDVLILAVALAVAAVPEGLPGGRDRCALDWCAAHGKRNAIVRHLAAVETLGSATVIASDKTGTLTKNEMTVRVVVTASGRVTFDGSGYAPDGAGHAEGGGAIEGPLRLESNARWRWRIARTTPRCSSETAGGPCKVIRLRVRCSSRHASAGSVPPISTNDCRGSARSRSRPSAN